MECSENDGFPNALASESELEILTLNSVRKLFPLIKVRYRLLALILLKLFYPLLNVELLSSVDSIAWVLVKMLFCST